MSDHLSHLEALCAFGAAHPEVERIRVGDIELVFRIPPPKPYVAEPKTAEQIANEALEARRQAYRKEFGSIPSDELLARLP